MLGRIVTFVMPEHCPMAGSFRPAIVTKVAGSLSLSDSSGLDQSVNLYVFYDPGDRSRLPAQDVMSVGNCDPAQPEMGKWFWPVRSDA